MDARVCTVLYFLQGIIGLRCFKITECARMVFFLQGMTGGTDTGLADDVQKIGWNACVSALLCNLHIPRGSG